MEVGAGIARDGDVVEVGGVETGLLQTPARGEGRKAGGVLHAVQPLLLDRRDEASVNDNRRGCVAVKCVQS